MSIDLLKNVGQYWDKRDNHKEIIIFIFNIWRLSPAPVHNYITTVIPSYAAQLLLRCITTKTTSAKIRIDTDFGNKEIEKRKIDLKILRFSPQNIRVKYSFCLCWFTTNFIFSTNNLDICFTTYCYCSLLTAIDHWSPETAIWNWKEIL